MTPLEVQIMKILEEEAAAHQTTVGVLIGHDRSAWRTAARQRVMWRARTELKAPYHVIGKMLHRNHATIIHGIRKYEER